MLSTLGWAADLDEDTPFVEEQLFFGEVRSRFAKVYDEAEIGYPEKLDMLLGSWKLTELRRYGRKLGAEDIFPADHIIRLAAGRDGTNAHHSNCSLRLSASWRGPKRGHKRTTA